MKERTFEVYLTMQQGSTNSVVWAAEISHKPPKIMPRGVTMLSILSSVANSTVPQPVLVWTSDRVVYL